MIFNKTRKPDGAGLMPDDAEMLPKIFDGIEGWLWPDAGWLTAYLFNTTRDMFDKNRNAVIEFGTYKGKYLSLLYYLTRVERAPVLGVDYFKQTTPDVVRKGMETLFDDIGRLELMTADTKDLQPDDLKTALKGVEAKFISIDAEHTAPAVFSDLALAQELLAEGGVIAVDDYTNVHCPGVTEGAINFLSSAENTRLAAFTSCCNKLFLTTHSTHEFYLNAARNFIDDLDFTTSSKQFYTRSLSQNSQRLCGNPVWVISHVKAAADPAEQRVRQSNPNR